PYVVSQIKDRSHVVYQFKPDIINPKICSHSTLKTIKTLLEGVVENGTARNINGSSYKIAGKTGTSRKILNGEYQKLYRASFVGYFPADAPKFTCYVMIDEPSAGLIYGSSVAAPVFREIADKIYSTDLASLQETITFPENHNSKREYPTSRVAFNEDVKVVYSKNQIPIRSQPETPYVYIENSNNSVKLRPYQTHRGRVPNVVGMCAKDAVAVLENHGLQVKIVGRGKVESQSLMPDTPFKPKQWITIHLGS
ncbi:MAG: penicillin-binding transpeptidase domain-containing protein, partial [Bacteroidia bacterium]|nr:penicillin-binding transpeptidase domain-containing protein [Bacteroidia bacterium]